jgi:hypothetical protein
MISENDRALDILSFWHKIEFFIPFDLDDRMRGRDDRRNLWRARKDPASIVFRNTPEGKIVSGYTLYLGVFDKSDVKDIIRHTVAQTEPERIEDQQRADLDGRTCIASLRLDANACPLFESIEVSTLPWAVARVRSGGLKALTSDAFARARRGLADDMRNFEMNRPPPEAGADARPPLQPAEISALAGLVSDWSGFYPNDAHPEAAVVVYLKDAPKKAESQAPPADTDDDEDGADEDYNIGILNSFYIEDLEMVMADVAAGRLPDALRCFLTPVPETERQDLYTAEGRERIVRTLDPSRMNRGRWLGDPTQPMSLMQQFAINTARDRLAETGLVSVNGPPGTGKTTLLRDVIADNIVARARVLAGLNRAQEAFCTDQVTVSGRTEEVSLATLIPALTGYEMVVASTNNAAVENLSRDLPKQASIGGDSEFGYLQRVAHKVAAQKSNGHCRVLSEAEMPWGLIACALGRKANRRTFARRCFSDKIAPEARKTWAGDRRPLTLWEWRSEAKVPSFAEAVRAFRAADTEVETLIGQLTQFCDLHWRVIGHTGDSFCKTASQSLDQVRRNAATVEVAMHLARDEYEAGCAALAALREEERLLDRRTPPRWQMFFGSGAARDHRTRVRANADAQIQKAHDIADHKRKLLFEFAPAFEQATQMVRSAETQLCAAKHEWSRLAQSHDALVERYGAIGPPADLDELEEDRWQKTGLWHLPQLAQLRSNLFRMALLLHEAWLAEVAVPGGGFGRNLVACSQMLEHGVDGDPRALQTVWQSLFMVVPVVSTTFASCARQFRGLGAESIGWLLIDEAGQAVPQAAVGALHRAKRELVIGDPRQIEPVFTLPRRLIADLAALSPHTSNGAYSPDAVSVQFRADAGNPLGTKVQSEGDTATWIGSPLRVHRRCIDPMFGVANTIAYQNKMIFGLAHRLPGWDTAPFYGASAWIDISGRVEGRQTVPEQIDFVAGLLGETYAEFGQLPNLYLISPFKEVKENLIRKMQQSPLVWGTASRPPDSKLKGWLAARIGTVHTFQGKEEDTVIMILGADAQTQGAAAWAASKPNILNVALTRAKRRFYMVGDRGLWSGQRFFSDAACALPAVTQADFIRQVKDTWRVMSSAETG